MRQAGYGVPEAVLRDAQTPAPNAELQQAISGAVAAAFPIDSSHSGLPPLTGVDPSVADAIDLAFDPRRQ